jgi:hypothetical protein
VAGGFVGARNKAHIGKLTPEPHRRVVTGSLEGGIRSDAWKSEQIEQARDAFVQGAVDTLQNIVKTFHLQKPETFDPVQLMQSLTRHNPSARAPE